MRVKIILGRAEKIFMIKNINSIVLISLGQKSIPTSMFPIIFHFAKCYSLDILTPKTLGIFLKTKI